MKPVIIIFMPRTIFDAHHDQLHDTATWREYQGKGGDYMVCALKALEYSKLSGGLNMEQIDDVCGGLAGNPSVMIHETNDYRRDLRTLYGLVPHGVEVQPE